MKKNIYIILVVVFVSGIGAGFFLGQYYDRVRMHRMMERGPERLEEMIVERLVRQLHLEDNQITAVREKVMVMAGEMDAEHRRRVDEMHARMTHLLVEIRPLLNEAQQKVLDSMSAEDLRPGPPPLFPDGKRPRMGDEMGHGPHPGDFHGGGMPPPPGRP